MNEITWKYVKELKNKDSIEAFEKANNIKFPDDMKEILKNNNGGRPSLRYFDLGTEKDKEFKTLLSFNESDIENIYKYVPLDSEDKTIIPFASDPAGNYFVLISGKIGYWNHELDKTIVLSNTFSEFLKLLHK